MGIILILIIIISLIIYKINHHLNKNERNKLDIKILCLCICILCGIVLYYAPNHFLDFNVIRTNTYTSVRIQEPIFTRENEFMILELVKVDYEYSILWDYKVYIIIDLVKPDYNKSFNDLENMPKEIGNYKGGL